VFISILVDYWHGPTGFVIRMCILMYPAYILKDTRILMYPEFLIFKILYLKRMFLETYTCSEFIYSKRKLT
jgi:hypothetical protein